jgi:hypothetical protein
MRERRVLLGLYREPCTWLHCFHDSKPGCQYFPRGRVRIEPRPASCAPGEMLKRGEANAMRAWWSAGAVLGTRRSGSQGRATALRCFGWAAHTCGTTMIGGAGAPKKGALHGPSWFWFVLVRPFKRIEDWQQVHVLLTFEASRREKKDISKLREVKKRISTTLIRSKSENVIKIRHLPTLKLPPS